MLVDNLKSGAGGALRLGESALLFAALAGMLALANRAPNAPPPATTGEKLADRLAWAPEDAPVRVSQSYDSLAMFALPRVEPVAWSEAEASEPRAARPPEPQPAALSRPPRVAVLPPARPAAPAAIVATVRPTTDRVVVASAAPEARDGRLRILGIGIPGSELISTLPRPAEALSRIASLGETIGLR